MSKFNVGRLSADPVVNNRNQYYDMLRENAQSQQSVLGAGITGLDALEGMDITGATSGVDAAIGTDMSEVDKWEQAVRNQQPTVIQQKPQNMDQLEADARNAYGIPGIDQDARPTVVPQHALAQPGFNFKEFSDSSKTPIELIDQGTVSGNLIAKQYNPSIRRHVKKPLNKTQSESTITNWMNDQQAFTSTFARAGDWDIEGNQGNFDTKGMDNPLNIIKHYLGHLDNRQIISLLFAAGMGGFRQERHVNVDEQDRVEFNLDPNEKFYAGEREGRPRDFRIVDMIGNLIEDNSFTKIPTREKKILAVAVADSIAATPSLELSKQYENKEGELVAIDEVPGIGNVNVFYEYSDNSSKTFGYYEGLILEANPSLRVNLRVSPVLKENFNDMTPLRGQKGFNNGNSPERGRADKWMSEEAHLLDEKLLGIAQVLLNKQEQDQTTIWVDNENNKLDPNNPDFDRMSKNEILMVDPWKEVFKKTGPQVLNSVFQQYQILAEQGTNIFYQAAARYINGRSGYKESINTKSNTFLRAAALPLTAQSTINLSDIDAVNDLKEDIVAMLGQSGLLTEAKLAFYEQHKSVLVKLGQQLESIGDQVVTGTSLPAINVDIDPELLGKWMPEKFDSVQALREIAKLEYALSNKDKRPTYHTYFVVEGDSTASGPSIVAHVMASEEDIKKTGGISDTADLNRSNILEEEMHQANADAAKYYYDSDRNSDESGDIEHLDNFLITAFNSLDTAFSRSLAKAYSTPSIYGAAMLSAKMAYANNLWSESNQQELLDNYTADEITANLSKISQYMKEGFNSQNKNLLEFKAKTQKIGREFSRLGVLADWITTGKGKNPDLIPHVQMSDGLRLAFFPTKFTVKESFLMSNPRTGISVVDISEASPDYERETEASINPQAFDSAAYDAKVSAREAELTNSILGTPELTKASQGKDVSSIVARHIVVLTIQALDNLIESKFINKFKSKYPDVYLDVVFDAIRVPTQYRREAFKMYNDIHKEITFNDNVIFNLGKALQRSIAIMEADVALMKRLKAEGKIDDFKDIKNFAKKKVIEGKNMVRAYKDFWAQDSVDSFFDDTGITTFLENRNLK